MNTKYVHIIDQLTNLKQQAKQFRFLVGGIILIFGSYCLLVSVI